MEAKDSHGMDHQRAKSSSGSSITAREKENEDSHPHAEISTEGHDRILQLARRLTSQSVSHRHEQEALPNPFIGANDPKLDPQSDQFDPGHWARLVIRLASEDPAKYPQRRAGVSFRNLSVSGYTSLVAYQKTFASALLEPVEWVTSLIREKDTVRILKEHDGLLRSGEMLLVLGRPGRFVPNSTNPTLQLLLILW